MAHNCENCNFRAHYDKKPYSFLGKFWRWHINYCPGWKGYFTSQSEGLRFADFITNDTTILFLDFFVLLPALSSKGRSSLLK
jgi:hypothetical protein